MKNVITFCTNETYIHYSDALVHSILKSGTNCDIVIRAVNCATDKINHFNTERVAVIEDNMPLNTVKKYIKNRDDDILSDYGVSIYTNHNIDRISGILYSEEMAYTCHSRFKTILELHNSYDKVLALDADTVVIKNIDCLFDSIDNYDIGTILTKAYTGDTIYYERGRRVVADIDTFAFFDEGIFISNNTEKSISYLTQIVSDIEHEFIDWDCDSRILYKRRSGDMKILSLDAKFKDKTFSNDSYMWSGDCVGKYNTIFNDKCDENINININK